MGLLTPELRSSPFGNLTLSKVSLVNWEVRTATNFELSACSTDIGLFLLS